jgi:hypothetical protein
MKIQIDENMLSAIVLHFRLKLQPGGCLERLMIAYGKVSEEAMYSGIFLHYAHIHIRDREFFDGIIKIFRFIPFSIGENYHTWKGFDYMSSDEKEKIQVMFKLQGISDEFFNKMTQS